MLGGRCFANLFRQLFVEKLIVLLAIEAVGGIDQQVLVISPEYTKPRWVGIGGTIRKNPCLAICRSQQDVEIWGERKRLIREARSSHWMTVYGDYLREVGYAAQKIGVTWDNVSDAVA